MMTLEKALILRQFSFLKNHEKQILGQKLREKELYNLTQPLVEEALGKRFSRNLRFKKVYPQVIHTQEHLLSLQNISTCLWSTPDYPFLLTQIYDPPFVLFYKGSLPSSQAFAVVGSRTVCVKSLCETQRLGKALGAQGIPVVSGLAQGIDTAVHRGVVDSRGQAFAILATSVDDIYPKTNRTLVGSLLYYGGGLISETAPQEAIGRYSFAKRNRIISGLCMGTLVMVAAMKSGALITAQSALDQGRDVYMWDHPVAGEGVRHFLEQGALPYRQLADLSGLLGEGLGREAPSSPALEKTIPEVVALKRKLSVEDCLIEDLIRELGI